MQLKAGVMEWNDARELRPSDLRHAKDRVFYYPEPVCLRMTSAAD